jgi:spoIIIJ-associated protein
MIKCLEMTGKTAIEATQAACEKMGRKLTEVEYEILDEGSKGFLGLGARPAKVKVWVIGYDEAAEKAKEEARRQLEAEKAAKEKAAREKAEKAEKERAEKEKAEKAKAKEENTKETNQQPQQTVAEEPKSERPQLTENDKVKVIDEAKKFLLDIFATMHLDVEIDAKFLDNKQLVIDMSGPEMGVVIGKRGQTLDSLQHLVGLVVNKGEFAFITVTLDTEGYRRRRKETLEHLAFNLAKKAKHLRKNVVLEPMNPYERRIIHSTLQNDRYVTTYSEGVEPHRYVVIAPKSRDRNN